MANNYSQPFYGMPFHYPPPQIPQQGPNIHTDPRGGFQDMSQPPTQSPFQHIPGLQLASPAPQATNNLSYSQNGQQSPFPPAGWPSDPNALFAFMQSVSQNGQLPPPPLPGFTFPSPSLPHTPQLPATPTAFAPQPIQPLATASGRLQELLDSDREDGEVSDGDLSHKPPSMPARPSGTGPPRSMPATTRAAPDDEEEYNPDEPAAGQAVNQTATTAPTQPSPMEELQQKRDEAKQFIKLLNSNNMGYNTLAKEDLDPDLLRDMYSSLNLPSAPAPIAPPKPAAAPARASQPTQPRQQKSAPAVKTTASVAAPVKSAPSPVDRQEYIARLLATKKTKPQATTKQNQSQTSSPAREAPPVKAVQLPKTSTPSSKPPITDEQRARNTEIIKKRLEELKAKGQPTSLADTVSRLQNAQAGQQAASGASTPGAQASSLAAIPGLFTTPAAPTSGSAFSTANTTVAQKRPALSESTDSSTPRGSVTPYTRPLGALPKASQRERVVIEVSEDDSNGSEMDIDEDQGPSQSIVTTPSASRQGRQRPGILRDFPAQPGSGVPGSSTTSTPGPQTPASQAGEDELKRKEDELAAMRTKLIQKLADRKARDRASQGAATSTAATPQFVPPPTTQAPPITPSMSTKRSASASVTNDANDSNRDVKRRRRAEIETELPSMDAELASNNAKMAKLAEELEALKVLNDKLAVDKQRLTDELENLGIDTDGMSHAEMRAKHDEIVENGTPDDGPGKAANEVSTPMDELSSSAAPATMESEDVRKVPQHQKDAEVSSVPQSSGLSGGIPGLSYYNQPVEDNSARPSQVSTVDESVPSEQSAVPTTSLSKAENPQQTASAVPPQSGSIFTNGQSAPAMRASTSPPEDDDDFYSPHGPEAASSDDAGVALSGHGQTDQTKERTQSADGKSLTEEGQVEMSESPEEAEYEPEESTAVSEVHTQEAQPPELEPKQSVVASDVSTEDEEAYEPPDVDADMSDRSAETPAETNGGVSELQSDVEMEDGAMDIASSSDDSSDSDRDYEDEQEEVMDGDSAAVALLSDSISFHRGDHPDTDIADDLAPQLQPQGVPESLPATEETEEGVNKFTPYESPLRMFKSYRYHPHFSQDVAGGFMSPTFSHQIDDEKPFCQYETAGGTCNDTDCPYQHFRSMGITGEALLVQIGTANPGKTPEEKQQWNDGLRAELKELRKKGIKDPNGIAAEIAKYRRRFLQDDTRVVNL